MQQGANQALARRKKRINQNGDKALAERRIHSSASHLSINNGSAGLDEQPSLERNSEKPCHLEL